jgi:predicted membrane protein
MSLLSILIALVIAGVVLWLINTFIPMDSKIKTILNVVVVIIVIAWLLNAFGVFGSQSNIHIGNLHMRW